MTVLPTLADHLCKVLSCRCDLGSRSGGKDCWQSSCPHRSSIDVGSAPEAHWKPYSLSVASSSILEPFLLGRLSVGKPAARCVLCPRRRHSQLLIRFVSSPRSSEGKPAARWAFMPRRRFGKPAARCVSRPCWRLGKPAARWVSLPRRIAAQPPARCISIERCTFGKLAARNVSKCTTHIWEASRP